MPTYFRTKVHPNIGTTPVDVLTSLPASKCTIIGCNLANATDGDVLIDVTVVDGSSVSAHYVRQLLCPPYSSIKVITNGEKLILAENCILRVTCDTDNGIDAVISYAEVA